MKKLVHEVHRRSLWQVLGIYLAASWVVLQVVAQLGESLGLPEWVEPFAFVLLLIGLPIVLATAFVQEGGSTAPAEAGPAPATDSQPAAPAAPAARAPEEGTRHRMFTWRNAVVGGVLAFAMLGVVTVGWMVMRTAGVGPAGSLVAKGVLDERGEVLLASFVSADPALSRSATAAFRIDLSQSRVVRLVDAGRVSEALARMGRPADEPLTPEVAREIGVREGIPTVIEGEIVATAGGYSLSAVVVTPQDGVILASDRQVARDSAELLPAIDKLSSRLRERIGESYRDLRADPPLEQVSTSSLEALRRYSEAVHVVEIEGDWPRAIGLLEEAVEIDSTFAMAWRKLSVELRNGPGELSDEIRALEAAYRHRDRLTDRERYLVEAAYADVIDRDGGAAIAAYENILRLDPDDAWATNNIGYQYFNMRNWEQAETWYQRAADLDTTNLRSLANVAFTQANVGKTEQAAANYSRIRQRTRSPQYLTWNGAFEAMRGDYEAAAAIFDSIAAENGQLPGLVSFQRSNQARLLAIQGRFRQAEGLWQQAIRLDESRGAEGAGPLLNKLRDEAWIQLRALADTAGALELIEDALARYPLEGFEPLDRPAPALATLLALAGRPGDARAVLEDFVAELSLSERKLLAEDIFWAEGAIAEAEGRIEDARDTYDRADGLSRCLLCLPASLAVMYDDAGIPDSAIVYYRAYVDTPWNFSFVIDDAVLARSLERLGQLYDEAGDPENAAVYYAQFVDLWDNADAELQPRVQAARARLEEIVRERG